MITGDQILCHMIGDYLLQSDWMAQRKTKSWVAANVHALTYTSPFAVMLWLQGMPWGQMWPMLTLIECGHFLIDHMRLARYVCYLKNFLAPRWIKTGRSRRIYNHPDHRYGGGYVEPILARNHPWEECKATGYHAGNPEWLSTWLMIITDNTLHVLLNGLILYYIK